MIQIKRKNLRNFTIILILILPLVSAGLHDPLPSFSVWIVNADSNDESANLAVQTILQETTTIGVDIRETTLSRLGSVPLYVSVLVLVGHGEPNGLQTSETLIPWLELYNAVAERQPEKTVVLACHSPSDASSNVFGFEGRVDAEAGAIIIGWYLKQITMPDSSDDLPFNRVAKAQEDMRHPLGRYLYLVHGYWGYDSGFQKMLVDFTQRNLFTTDYDEVKFFDYYLHYNATTTVERNLVHYEHTISDYADNFYNELLSIPTDSQINIIGHSLGGIITREMLRLHRTELDTAGIDVGKVITLGTPHQGTELADPANPWAVLVSIIGGLINNATLWPSPVFWSIAPWSPFLCTLNSDPMSYSHDIDWYTVSGYEPVLSTLLWGYHGDFSDPIVARGRAHLSFAETEDFDVEHSILIDDTQGTTYETVFNWIREGPDTDGDQLTDDAETYFYGTDPLDWDTDGDGIGDDVEIDLGYNPLNPSSPIPASELISSVSVISSSRTVKVYVNHFPAMDYVKFYVRYKTKTGSWTGSTYMGTDSSPTTGGDYYKSWIHPTGYVQMKVMVSAYDSGNNWLGYDNQYQAISDGGGGGGGPPIE
ncbi:MAG: esterase/lipase family protein [Candidatus Thorarchaeota archaeon]|jgi:pimeloyl-ACP methyl ester carboxylesterase